MWLFLGVALYLAANVVGGIWSTRAHRREQPRRKLAPPDVDATLAQLWLHSLLAEVLWSTLQYDVLRQAVATLQSPPSPRRHARRVKHVWPGLDDTDVTAQLHAIVHPEHVKREDAEALLTSWTAAQHTFLSALDASSDDMRAALQRRKFSDVIDVDSWTRSDRSVTEAVLKRFVMVRPQDKTHHDAVLDDTLQSLRQWDVVANVPVPVDVELPPPPAPDEPWVQLPELPKLEWPERPLPQLSRPDRSGAVAGTPVAVPAAGPFDDDDVESPAEP